MSMTPPPGDRHLDRPGDRATVERCFVCVDLVGYSALTDSHGDDAAVDLALALAHHAAAALGPADELVKQLGDGVLLATSTVADAVRLVERLLASLDQDDFVLAVRVGMHHGSAVRVAGPTDVDYFGAAVNVAARLSHEARPGEIIGTAPVAADADDLGHHTAPGGARQLRHIGEAVDVFVIALASSPPATELDPVCHMRPGRGGFAVMIQWQGRRIGFCSDDCARRFAVDPLLFASHLDDC